MTKGHVFAVWSSFSSFSVVNTPDGGQQFSLEFLKLMSKLLRKFTNIRHEEAWYMDVIFIENKRQCTIMNIEFLFSQIRQFLETAAYSANSNIIDTRNTRNWCSSLCPAFGTGLSSSTTTSSLYIRKCRKQWRLRKGRAEKRKRRRIDRIKLKNINTSYWKYLCRTEGRGVGALVIDFAILLQETQVEQMTLRQHCKLHKAQWSHLHQTKHATYHSEFREMRLWRWSCRVYR